MAKSGQLLFERLFSGKWKHCSALVENAKINLQKSFKLEAKVQEIKIEKFSTTFKSLNATFKHPFVQIRASKLVKKHGRN